MRVASILPTLLLLAACSQEEPVVPAALTAPLPESPEFRRQRFFSGHGMPGEFLVEQDLPTIPPTFDEALP
ncbi:hypothetical protein FQZ97_392320 [compost metagenome]